MINPDEITNRFFATEPTENQKAILQDLSIRFCNFAAHINRTLPDSREKSLVLTKLEEAKFFASAAVTRNRNIQKK